jgi:predicted secreted protein
MKVTFVALVAVAWLALTAVSVPQPDLIATDAHNGGRMQLRSGQLFDIVLADDYDQTGCQWRDESSEADSVLQLLGQRYEPNRKPPNGNANGTNTERYRAGGHGTATISLVESDNAGKVCRRYTVDVAVTSPSLADALAAGVTPVLRFAIPVVGAIALVTGGPRLWRRLRQKLSRLRRGTGEPW